ncbi:MAG: hypothetical protein V2A73_08635 [Pseudomonadota bacterium]
MATAAELAIRIQARENTKPAFDRVKRHLKETESAAQKVSTSMAHFGATMTKVMSGLAIGVGVPLLAVGGAFTKLAMDANESEDLFNRSMGKMATDARRWSESLSDSLKLNAYEVRQNVGTMNLMFDSLGMGEQAAYSMSKGITKLAYDLSSLYNLPTDEAFQKLQAGISGETEPLKRLGIIVNETTVKQWALTQGLIKQGDELSEAQKVYARYMLIMEQTAKAQGNLAETITSPTNQLRAMKAQFEEIGIEVGTNFLPILSAALTWISEDGVPAARGAIGQLQASWTEMGEEGQTRIITLAVLAGAAGPLATALAYIPKALRIASIAFAAFANVAATRLGRIATMATGVGVALVAAEAGMSQVASDYAAQAERFRRMGEEVPETDIYERARLSGLSRGAEISAANAKRYADLAGTPWKIVAENIEVAGGEFDNFMAKYDAAYAENVAKGGLPEVLFNVDDEISKAFGKVKDLVAGFKASSGPLGKGEAIFPWLEETRQQVKDLDRPLKLTREQFAGLGKAAQEMGEAAQAAAQKAGVSMSQFVQNLVNIHPAVLRVNADIAGWEAQIVSVNLAIKANQDQAKAAQREYQAMSKHLSELNRQLSEAQAKLNEFSQPRLKGSGQLEMQIGAVEAQLKRVDLAGMMGLSLSDVTAQFPLLTKGAEAFLGTLSTDKATLETFLAQLRLTQSLKFDEKMNLLAKAAETAVAEMDFRTALQGIFDTRERIDGLTEAITTQEVAMVRQQEVIDSIERAAEALNGTLAVYQEQLRISQERLTLLTDALKAAYDWLLSDRDKIIEMGGEAVTQAGVVDEQTRLLLRSIDLYTSSVAGGVQGTLDSIVRAYSDAVDKALAQVARLPGVPAVAGAVGVDATEAHAGGGTVGGPMGRPRVIVAHGGERISRPWEGGGRAQPQIIITGNTFLADDRATAGELARLLKPELDRLVRMH